MKIYLIERTDRVGYDEYDSYVVIAKNRKKAESLIDSWGCGPKNPTIKVTEIKLDKEQILLGSFNAG